MVPPREPISISREVIEAWRQGRISTSDMAIAVNAHVRAQREKDQYILSLFADFEKGSLPLSTLIARTKDAVKQDAPAQEPRMVPPREPISISREVIEAWRQGRISTSDMAIAVNAHVRAQREKDQYILSLFADFEKGNLPLSTLIAQTKDAVKERMELLLRTPRNCVDRADGAFIGCSLGGGLDDYCAQVADIMYCICLGGIYSEGGWCAIM